MKKSCLIFTGIFFLVQAAVSKVLEGNHSTSDTLHPTGFTASAAIGIIVAGVTGWVQRLISGPK